MVYECCVHMPFDGKLRVWVKNCTWVPETQHALFVISDSNMTLLWIALVDSKESSGACPLKIFHFYVVFGENWPNSRLSPLWGWRSHLENPRFATGYRNIMRLTVASFVKHFSSGRWTYQIWINMHTNKLLQHKIQILWKLKLCHPNIQLEDKFPNWFSQITFRAALKSHTLYDRVT